MRLLKVILLLLLISSCKGNSNNDVSIVELPDGMQLLSGNYTKTFNGIHSDLRLIAYYDSTTCTNCAIKNVYAWASLINIVEKYRDKASVVLIFAPRKNDVDKVRKLLEENMIDYPVYLDTASVFRDLNNEITSFPYYCIIDRQGEVKISGSPFANTTVYKNYINVLNKELLILN